MKLFIILGIIAVLISWYIAIKALVKAEDAEDRCVHLAAAIARIDTANRDLKKTVEVMQDTYDKAAEFIEATAEYTKEAANREKLMQDGITAIMGYDAMAAIKNTGGDNG